MDKLASISFDNTECAFAYKKDKALKRAHFLFSSMGKPWLINLGLKLTPVAIKWNLPFTKPIIRSTIFAQFVGGETLQETASVAKILGEYNVQVILDYGVEGGGDGEPGFEHSTKQFIGVIEYAATQPNIPFMSVKVTGLARFGLLEKIDAMMHQEDGSLMKRYIKAVHTLDHAEKEEWHNVRLRLLHICETAAAKKVAVLIDAEETWIQDPVDALTMLMMDTFNKGRVIIYNTLQLYRHDRLAFLKDSYEASVERDFVLGIKLVRGAYMEKERERAVTMGYPSPIQPDKKSCDRDYDAAVTFCIDHLDKIAVVVASHNENSNLLTTELLKQKNLSPDHPHVHLSQLYGMSDNITFNLANAGCSVSKYLPFGPIKDVVPYLMRRAQENSSVAGQTGRELGLIEKEIKRRRI
ncbi:MAG: proline dehydrogenase family protein [Chitinophagaceae bacterium]|nr:proline dehydrogenase family protein [Chitinophagaceae bacterium]